ncbi:MAG TPA: O-antigen ligase family protein [Methylomirabilota bacterium]|nr:O-antigen ligase family protein [Methylomirabilota bacterium]
MKHKPPEARAANLALPGKGFAFLTGSIFGLALIFWGTPVVLDDPAVAAHPFMEVLGAAAPTHARYWLVAVLVLTGLPLVCWRSTIPRWVLILPALWLGWQFVSATQTVDGALTRATLKHFAACVVIFYTSALVLSRNRNLAALGIPLGLCFLWMLRVGFEQRFGGLEATREYFYLYILPNLEAYPRNFVSRMSSDRIYATLFYPNALAGVILLHLPMLLVTVWTLGNRLTVPSRCVLVAVFALASLACLLWSGSKTGWLVMAAAAFLVFLRLPLPLTQRWKLGIAAAVLVVGLAGFAWKYADLFERGPTSVVARLDYWRAAWLTLQERPLTGTGPGTFAVAYARVKPPEAEMAKLAHNDYIEQASDSGIPGFLAYTVLILGSVGVLYRRSFHRGQPFEGAVWLGVACWSLQSFMEFGLYIPALAWPAFGYLGWLWGMAGNAIDKPPPAG